MDIVALNKRVLMNFICCATSEFLYNQIPCSDIIGYHGPYECLRLGLQFPIGTGRTMW